MTISTKIDPGVARRATDHFSRVPGYLSKESAEIIMLFGFLQQRHGISGDILEIGAFKARSSLFFAKLLEAGETLHVSDLFDQQELNVSHSIGHGFEAWRSNFDRFKEGEPKIQVHHGPSNTLDASKLGNGFRLAYLDGGHATDEVESDLMLAQAILKPGGIAIVDDTFFEEFPGTTEGLIRFLYRQEARLVPFLCFDRKVALIEGSIVDPFREEFMGCLDGQEHLRFPDQMLAGRQVSIVGLLGPWEIRSKRLRRRLPWLHALLERLPAARAAFDRLRGAGRG